MGLGLQNVFMMLLNSHAAAEQRHPLSWCKKGASQTSWQYDITSQVQDTGRVSVVLCSSTGNLFLWPAFTQSDDVATHRVSGTVTAVAAGVDPGEEA